MKKELLAYLACPRCNANLSLKAVAETSATSNGAQEIIRGTLQCAGGHQFPVARGVPRLVEGQPPASIQSAQKDAGVSSTDYTQQFFECVAPLSKSFVQDKIVLDAGCGDGKYAGAIAESGARVVIAVDISDSVDAAYANLKNYDNVHVVQGEINALPVKPIFELICSIGVLHYMDNPSMGFKSLYKKLNHEGAMAVWVYGKENNWPIAAIINPVKQLIAGSLPQQSLNVVSRILAAVFFFLARNVYSPWCDLREEHSALPRLIYEAQIASMASLNVEGIDRIVYDYLVAPAAQFLPRDEVKSWADDAACAFSQIRWHNQNSWTLIVSRNLDHRNEIRAQQRLQEKLRYNTEIESNASAISGR